MPVLDNEFTCPNGHSFKANAKLRARCSQCGSMARKDFTAPPKVESKEEPIKVKSKEAPKVEPKAPRLIRQGKPRMPIKKPVVKGKIAGGLVKSRQVVGKAAPKISGMPRKTNRARITETARGESKPYWKSVAERFGF